MRVYVASVGAFAPGFASWAEGKVILAGEGSYRHRNIPALQRVRLPPNEARRVSFPLRLALQLSSEAMAAMPAIVPTGGVFACSGGNTEALGKLLPSLLEGAVSPNQFANVGHSAAAGYWSISIGGPAPTSSIAAYDGTFAAGLVEAATTAVIETRTMLLVCCDVPPPAVLTAARPVRSVCGVALIMTPTPPPVGGAALDLALAAEPEDRLEDAALEGLRQDNPAARALPLIRLIARAEPGRIALPYLASRSLVVHHEPCCSTAWRSDVSFPTTEPCV